MSAASLSPVVVMRASNSSGGRDPSSDVIASRIACETSGDAPAKKLRMSALGDSFVASSKSFSEGDVIPFSCIF